jgi:transposase-like protein
MAGGEGNPLGARALYLGDTLYRIHGTNQPSTIGSFVSSGCIRLTNEDIMDLYKRVKVGTRVVVLPSGPPITAAAPIGSRRGMSEVTPYGLPSASDMPRKRYKPEEITAKLQQVDVLVARGQSIADATRQVGISESRYYRWREERGAQKRDELKKPKEPAHEGSKGLLRARSAQFGITLRGSSRRNPPASRSSGSLHLPGASPVSIFARVGRDQRCSERKGNHARDVPGEPLLLI